MKPLLIGIFLVTSPLAAWAWRAAHPPHPGLQAPASLLSVAASSSVGAEQIPVEVVARGSAPQWVVVEVQGQSVPEPGVISLLAVASLWLLRRQRERGQ